MLSQHLGMPFRRDVLKRALANSFERSGSISPLCWIVELMGLNSSWLMYLQPPSVCKPSYAQVVDSFALLYKSVKRTGSSCTRNWHPTHQTSSFHRSLGEDQVLLLQTTKDTPKQRFGWFLPSSPLPQSIGSFDCFLFLCNCLSGQPLITQVIIKVLVQTN